MASPELRLPADYPWQTFLAFHRRDREALAERVRDDCLYKGLLWRDWPACLHVRRQGRRLRARLDIDGPASAGDGEMLTSLLRRILGLNQPVARFTAQFRQHPQLGALLRARPGLRLPQAPQPFEALCWAIIGQQISLAAAIAIRRRFIQAAGLGHSAGLLCFPGPAQVLRLSREQLRAAGLSALKAEALLAMSREALEDPGFLAAEPTVPWQALRERLLALPGIGPWTADYTLLRGFGWLDASLHGDAALRRNLQFLLGRRERISTEEARRWLEPFSPWRSLVAMQLWHMERPAAY